jgi:hypothetical protein
MLPTLLPLLLPLLSLTTFTLATPDSDRPGPEAIVSVTAYDSPHSSGESTWTVPTTVSYMTGSDYTSMMMPTATGGASSPAGTETGGKSSASASTTAEPYHGAAYRGSVDVGMGAGMVLVAGGLALFL